MAQVGATYQDQVDIVGVAARDSVEAMREFTARHGLNGVIVNVVDAEQVVWTHFGISYQPAWVFLDPATGERETIAGALGGAELEARIRQRLDG